MQNSKVPVTVYDALIGSLNELSEKFGYSLKTYNLLGLMLMNQGETEKACKIFQSALDENQVFSLEEGDPMLHASNHDLGSIIYNYIKSNAILNMHGSMVQESYIEGGLQQTFLRTDELSIKLFTILSKMQSPLAKDFFSDRQQSEALFDQAIKQTQ